MTNKKMGLTAFSLVVSSALLFTACKKDDDVALNPIDGYNNSNEVAATNLKAHWSFEGVTKEDISGVDVNASLRNSFVTGPKGSALHLDSGYLKYPAIPNIKSGTSLNSFTVSCWVNMKNKGNSFTQLFSLAPSVANAGDIWGNINLGAETGWFPATSDTLVPKFLMVTTSNGNQDNRPDPNGTPPIGVFHGANKWSHIVTTWNAATSKLQMYGDTVHISAYDTRGGVTNVTFKDNDAFIIGSILNSELGYTAQGPNPDWAKWFTGSIDEIRVYNKALSTDEIQALWKLEKVGR